MSRIFSIFLILSFTITSLYFPQDSYAANNTVLGLPVPGTMVGLSESYVPMLIKGLRVHPDNPLLFDFIVDTGHSGIAADGKALRVESEKLIKYFLATLAIPEKELWVNLSPYEKDRIIPQSLGQTEMGREMLAQDYMLKQITASLIYPEKEVGKKFWDKVYAQAQAQFGTTEIPVNTFNKVWILPDQASVFVRNNTAYVVKAHLKVMLEEDYLALGKNTVGAGLAPAQNNRATARVAPTETHGVASKIVREIILPELEREVNQGKNFASLRQVFHSLVLASWYKKNIKEAFLNQVYSNKSKIDGVDVADKDVKQKIYQQYLAAYKKGVFNYIKEDVNRLSRQPMPKKYFSGGLDWAQTVAANPAIVATASLRDLKPVTVFMNVQTGFSGANAAMTANDTSLINQIKAMRKDLNSNIPNSLIESLIASLIAYVRHGEEMDGVATLKAQGLLNADGGVSQAVENAIKQYNPAMTTADTLKAIASIKERIQRSTKYEGSKTELSRINDDNAEYRIMRQAGNELAIRWNYAQKWFIPNVDKFMEWLEAKKSEAEASAAMTAAKYKVRVDALVKKAEDLTQKEFPDVYQHSSNLIAEFKAAVEGMKNSTGSNQNRSKLAALDNAYNDIDLMQTIYQEHATLLKRLPATAGYELDRGAALAGYNANVRTIREVLNEQKPEDTIGKINSLAALEQNRQKIYSYEESIVLRSMKSLNQYNNPARTQGQLENWISQADQITGFSDDARRTYDNRHDGGYLPARDFFVEGLAQAELALEIANEINVPDNERNVVIARDARLIEMENVDALIAAYRARGLNLILVAEEPNSVSSYSYAVQKYKPLVSIMITSSHVSRHRRAFVRGLKVKIRPGSWKTGGQLQGLTTDQIKNVIKKKVEKISADFKAGSTYADQLRRSFQNSRFVNIQKIEEEATRYNTFVGYYMHATMPEGSEHPSLYQLAKELGSLEGDAFVQDMDRQLAAFQGQKPMDGLRVVVNAGHTPSGFALQVIRKLGAAGSGINMNVVEVNGEHEADPSIDKNNLDIYKRMKETNAHFGIGFDLDGDRGAVLIYTIDISGKLQVYRFDNLSQDDLLVFLLGTPAYKKMIKDVIKDGGKPAVIVDVLSSYAVEEAAKRLEAELRKDPDLIKALGEEKASKIEFKVFRTDAGYTFLEKERVERVQQGYVIINMGEKSGHGWSIETAEVENPIALAVKFMIAMQDQVVAGKLPSEIFKEYMGIFEAIKSPRYQPPVHSSFLASSIAWGHDNNRTTWDPQSGTKMPQVIYEIARHRMIDELKSAFPVNKGFIVTGSDGREYKFFVDSVEIEDGGRFDKLNRYLDIRFKDTNGRIVGRFVGRGSSNDPSFVMVYEAPIGQGTREDAQNWNVITSGVVNQVLIDKHMALITSDNIKADGKSPDVLMPKGNLGPIAADYENFVNNFTVVADAVMRHEGGIDFNTQNMKTDLGGETIKMNFDPAMMQRFRSGDFSGIRIQILGVTRLPSVLPLFGMAPRKEDEYIREKLAKLS